MCKYKRGDVVWALCAFSDGTGQKSRPCIILSVNLDCNYLIIECSSLKEKHSNLPGIIIKDSHPEYSNLGFLESSFINFSNKARLPEKFLKPPPMVSSNPVGFCNFIDDYKELK